jgi:ABC-type sugar transport system permease subunit
MIIAATIWQFTAYDMVIYYAGLQNIPQQLHEAAAIDGANGWTRIWKITIPLLAPVMTVTMLLNFIGGIRIFDIVFVMTRGGPNRASEVLATYLYEQGFKINVAGYASSLALVIVVIAFAVTYVRLRTAGGGEEL